MRRVVVITGASAGVGRATARAFAARGDAVALLARGRDGLDAAEREVRERGGRGLAIPTDVADAAAVDAAAQEVEQDLGPIDVWVNNAMVSVFAAFKDVSATDFRRVTEVTYLGYVHGTMSALRRMLARDRGVIVQVGSALAQRAIPLQSAYCGAKHAIEGFTESLRCELMHDKSGVSVTMVQLPALNTPQFGWVKTTFTRHPRPVPPIFQPEAAAQAIVWASVHPRGEYWFAWSTARAILANRIVPGLLDRYLACSGYDAQQGDSAIDPDRPHNLFTPVAGDAGARGRFNEDAKDHSAHWWVARHDGWRIAAGVAGAAALFRSASSRREERE